MTSHGIIMTAHSVRQLQAGVKTQSRRMSKRWLKVKAGDLLWVRESGKIDKETARIFLYSAAPGVCKVRDLGPGEDYHPAAHSYKSTPSIHMPRWASRITLIATEDAREERLWDISEADAVAEGCDASAVDESDVADMQISDHSPELKAFSRALGAGQFTAKFDYMMRWDSLHAKDAPWSSNPVEIRLAFRVQA